MMDRTTPVRQVTSTTKCNSPELSHSIDLNRFSSEDLYASLCSESIMHPLGLKGAQEKMLAAQGNNQRNKSGAR
jgi:hypothetical protein